MPELPPFKNAPVTLQPTIINATAHARYTDAGDALLHSDAHFLGGALAYR